MDDAGEIRTVTLAGGRRLVVRPADGDDLDAVEALYRRLPVDDLRRRFFVAHLPSSSTTTRWLTMADRGGVALVAEAVEVDGSRLVVAEAGYALLADGDGELAITVDPEWRGWLGGWLLDILATLAAERGVDNLHADVLVENRAMLGLLRHRGYAAADHPDWGTVRLVIATTGHTPGWPPGETGQRLLATAAGARWRGEAAAREAGFDVRTCAGPAGLDRSCPVLEGEACPLLDGVDAVVFDLVPNTVEHQALLGALEDQGVPLVITRPPGSDGAAPCASVASVIDQVVEQLGTGSPDPA